MGLYKILDKASNIRYNLGCIILCIVMILLMWTHKIEPVTTTDTIAAIVAVIVSIAWLYFKPMKGR